MSLIARSDPCGRVWIEDEENGRFPPRGFRVSFPQQKSKRATEVTLAIARKMAASDEMLEALKKVLERDGYQFVADVIAKAEGAA